MASTNSSAHIDQAGGGGTRGQRDGQVSHLRGGGGGAALPGVQGSREDGHRVRGHQEDREVHDRERRQGGPGEGGRDEGGAR